MKINLWPFKDDQPGTGETLTLTSNAIESILTHAGSDGKSIVVFGWTFTPTNDEVGTFQFFDENDVAISPIYRGGGNTFGRVFYNLKNGVDLNLKAQCSHAAFGTIEVFYGYR